MLILVRSGLEKTMAFQVESSDTILSVKKKIYEHEGTLPERQTLTYANQELVYDYGTLFDYGIRDQCSEIELDLKPHAPIQIVIEDKNVWKEITTLDNIEITDTVRSVKARIRDKLGIPIDQQSLYFDENLLDDDKSLLAQYSIVHDQATLELGLAID